MPDSNLKTESPEVEVPLDYARPHAQGPAHGTRVWAGLAILLLGLALIVLGGCFMIGVLGIVTDGAALGFKSPGSGPPAIGSQRKVLIVVLYVLAFVCFGGAATAIVVGARGLYRVMTG